MLRRFFIIIPALLMALSLTSCKKAPVEISIATVGDETITDADLKKAFAEQADDYGPDVLADPDGREVVKKNILNALIHEKVLLQVARDRGLTLSPEEAGEAANQEDEGYRKGEFEKILREKGISLEKWTEKQRRKKLIAKLIETEVYEPIEVTDAEVAEFYKKYRATFRVPDRVRCRQIVTDKKDKAEKIRALLEKGENFASVAQKYSESPDREKGGDLGYMGHGDFPEIFERACFTLATGQTSDVIQSEYGFHIFKVTDKQPGHQRSLEEAGPEIMKHLKDEKAAPKLREWLDAMYSNKKISIDEKTLRGVSVGGTL